MRWTFLGLAIAIAVTVAACHKTPAAPTPATGVDASVQPIAWREGDVDDALAESKETGKPIMLYWGAKWCPPCNELKSTVFKDPAFIAETRRFVPVHLDGDTAGA